MGPEGSNLKFSENDCDFWVLDKTNYKHNGYFVDLGAGDGVTGSNTFLLEKFYKWDGIVCDPNPQFLKSLCGARDCTICDLAVWSESGKILNYQFLADQRNFYGWNFRSGIVDRVSPTDIKFRKHKVYSISLNDLLDLYNAPTDIDYVKLDVEGSEVDILSTFDFTKYNVGLFTVESDTDSNRKKVIDILHKHGYTLVQGERTTEDRFEKLNEN